MILKKLIANLLVSLFMLGILYFAPSIVSASNTVSIISLDFEGGAGVNPSDVLSLPATSPVMTIENRSFVADAKTNSSSANAVGTYASLRIPSNITATSQNIDVSTMINSSALSAYNSLSTGMWNITSNFDFDIPSTGGDVRNPLFYVCVNGISAVDGTSKTYKIQPNVQIQNLKVSPSDTFNNYTATAPIYIYDQQGVSDNGTLDINPNQFVKGSFSWCVVRFSFFKSSAVTALTADIDNLKINANLSDNTQTSMSKIIRMSDDIEPGETFNIFGGDLNTTGFVVKAMELNGNQPTQIPPPEAITLEVLNVDNDGAYLTTRLPLASSAGLYAVWIGSTGNWSNPSILNSPRPQWLSEDEVRLGQRIRINGRCLDPKEFGLSNLPIVRLTDTSTLVQTNIMATNANPFAIEFDIPQDMALGTNTVEVSIDGSNWRGLEFSEYTNTLIVKAADSDPLNLGVWWAGDYKWANNYNPAVADNNTATINTTNINNAITTAYYAGGGIVNLPAGSFKVTKINLKNGVVLKGVGSNSNGTILKGTSSSSIIYADRSYGANGLMGISDIKITLDSQTPTYNYPDFIIDLNSNPSGLTRCFVNNVVTDMPYSLIHYDSVNAKYTDGRTIGIYCDANSHFMIKDCSFKGYISAPYCNIKTYGQILNTIVNTTTNHIRQVGVCSTFIGNTINIHKEYALQKPWEWNSEGIVARGPTYIADNTITGAGRDGNNDGEIILTENAGAGTKMYGAITSATENTVTVNPFRGSDYNFSNPLWGKYHIVITDGKGLGQYRVLTGGNSVTKILTVDKPWDILPDGTSKYSVVLPSKGVTVYNNYASDCAKGYWLYNDNLDSVIYKNQGDNTEGCLIHNYSNVHTATDVSFGVSYFNRLESNNMTGVSARSKVGFIGEIYKLDVFNDGLNVPYINETYAVGSYGTEIKDNTYTGPEVIEAPINYNEGPKINGICYSHSTRINITKPVGKCAILEGNSIYNSDRGITIGGRACPIWWFDAPSEYTRGVTGVIAKGNGFVNVINPYICNLGMNDAAILVGQMETRVMAQLSTNSEPQQKLTATTMQLKLEAKNIGATLQNAEFIVIIYNNNIIKNIYTTPISIAEGVSSTFTQQFTISSQELTTSSVKCFLWENKSTLKPLAVTTEYKK
jgi:hypothetical protein